MKITGHINIIDGTTKEVLVDKHNQIHFENFSEALAKSISSGPLNSNDTSSASGFIKSIAFGNGGTDVSPSGVITYKSPNYTGSSSTLYSQTFSKIVNQFISNNTDSTNNKLTISHLSGKAFTDILIQCQLGYNEPSGQYAFDNSIDVNGSYVFDELGLITTGGKLITHVIFHPIQKSTNRLLRISYTLRVSSLS
jgi:hypothetical protein